MYSTTPALVLAAQFVQFAELFTQSAEARFEKAAHAHIDVGKLGIGILMNDFLLGGYQFLGQGGLELGQAASL